MTSLTTKLGLLLQGTSLDLAPLPQGSDGDSEGDESEDGDGSTEDGKGPKGKGKGDAEEDSGDAEDDSEGSGTEGNPEEGKGSDADGEGGDSTTEAESPDGDSQHEAGGHRATPEIEYDGLAEQLLNALRNGENNGLLDNNEALKEAVGAEDTDEDLEAGERTWRPMNPSLDQVKIVNVTPARTATAEFARKEVRKAVSALRNRLRSKFLQARVPKVTHGVRNGRSLSDRRLVPSIVEIRSGRTPTRPDWQREATQDVTLAAAVVIDQSYSMKGGCQTSAMKGSLVIADALDLLGSPCLVVGPRNAGPGWNGRYDSGEFPEYEDGGRYHRSTGVLVDLFKDWEEPMTRAWPRFGGVIADGSTPLSDGIQYALQELNTRTERHRVVIVITDGMPDHSDVVRWQLRVAREAGVHVIGVGIGGGTGAVKTLFPTHVSCSRVDELPAELMAILEGLMFPKAGKRIAVGGKMPTRVSR